jgi:hypothetical protein
MKKKFLSLGMGLLLLVSLGLKPISTEGAKAESYVGDTPTMTGEYFQIQVKVTSSDPMFYIPLAGSGSTLVYYNWNVDWGDGNTINYNTGANGTANYLNDNVNHDYSSAISSIGAKDDYTFTITITPNNTTDSWLRAFGFPSSGTSGNAPSAANKNKLIKVLSPFTPLMSSSASNIAKGIAGDYVFRSMFYDCPNLTLADTAIFTSDWDNITSVGTNFACYMFTYCTSLTLPDNFNIPQDITTVGSNFLTYMFGNCSSLTSLPADFNIPQDITTVGSYFLNYMFCSSGLTSLPANFNIPQGIKGTVGGYFLTYMFDSCLSSTSLPADFNIPQGITTVGTYFLTYMFYNCPLNYLPADFNIPQGITTVGTYFLYSFLYNTGSNIFQINESFRLPVLDSTQLVKSNVLQYAFRLKNTSPIQNISAKTILNGNVEPSGVTTSRNVFNGKFRDAVTLPKYLSGSTTSTVNYGDSNIVIFAKYFISITAIACTNVSNGYTFDWTSSTAWPEFKWQYNNLLSSEEKSTISTSEDVNVIAMIERYTYMVNKYPELASDNWLVDGDNNAIVVAQSNATNVTMSDINSNDLMLIVSIFSLFTVCITAFLIYEKRKTNR